MSKEAMKLALEALTATMATHGFREHIKEAKDKAIKSLEEALSKQEQRSDSEHLSAECVGEPVGIVESAIQGAGGFHVKLTRHVMPMIGETLYTTPPQSEARGLSQQQRKPLTDEQILEILCIHLNKDDDIEDWRHEINEARAIEAAHGIKE
jgi:hypothetical protein